MTSCSRLASMLAIVAALAAGLVGAQEPEAPDRGTRAEPAEASTAIEAANRRLEKAVERQDARALADLYTEDGAVLAPGAPFVQGRNQIETFWKDALAGGIRGAALETLEVENLGDTAWERGKVTLTVQGDEGEPETVEAKYLVIWKRQPDGVWKLHRDIWNELPPGTGNEP